MCIVSAVGDFYGQPNFPGVLPGTQVWPPATYPNTMLTAPPVAHPSVQTLDELMELVRLLMAAHEYDVNNNERECASQEKTKVFKEALRNLQSKIAILAGTASTNDDYMKLQHAVQAMRDLHNLINELQAAGTNLSVDNAQVK